MHATLTATPPQTAFSWHAPVYFDDLDAMGMVHNAHFAVLLDRVITAFFESHGREWTSDPAENPDQHWAVRQQSFEYVAPYRGVGAVEVALWVESLGRTSATYLADFRSGQGVHVHGRRTVVKIDHLTGRPAPWTAVTRDQLTAIAHPAEEPC